MASETSPDSRDFPNKAGKNAFKNSPRSNRIVWILMIVGMGAFIFISYNLLDTPSPGSRNTNASQQNSVQPAVSPAVGQYSDAYAAFLKAFEENPEDSRPVAELPDITQRQVPQSGGRQGASQTQQSQQEQMQSFLSSIPKNVKVVHKAPSKEYTASRALLASALTANPEVKLDSSSGVQLSGMDGGSGFPQPLLAAAGDTSGGEQSITDAISPFLQQSNTGDLNSSAMAHQDRNDAFIQRNQAQAGAGEIAAQNADKEYIASTRRAPRGKYELLAGSLISGVLMGGINSDTPGSVLGQISENVYDTATGSHLLIPQGARMIGVYDSHVVYGQNRLVVVWQRILYPDGTSLNIEGMIGGDQAGNSGFKQYVDNHYSRLIGAALFASVFTAAGKIATDNDKDDDGNESKAAEAVMETMSQLGAKLAERNMNVAPTLRIRPGYRFSIVTTKDIAFAEPYWE
jgi:type IV secretory pathway VirB10-like protein